MRHLPDIRQSENYAKYLETQGWVVERIDNVNYFIKKLPLLGCVLKIQRPKTIDLEIIQKLERKYRVFETIIEPDLASVVNSFSDIHDSFLHGGYKMSKRPYLPSKTLHLDLTKPLMFNKETRRSIRIGEEQKIENHSSPKQIEIFYKAWKESVNFNRYVPSLNSLLSLRAKFPNNHSIFLTSHNKVGRIIGGAIFTTYSHGVSNYITYYWHGFTNFEGRTSLSQYSLLYQGILWGKKLGCKVFDFEGIYDDRFPNKSWLGFTHFKKSFGGIEILYPGCYTKFNLKMFFSIKT